MKLNQKTMLALGAAVIFSVAINFSIVQYGVLPDFEQLERAEAEEDLARIQQAVRNEVRHLSRFTWDWAAWDDSVDFIVTRSENYIQTNLIYETFEENGLNLIHFYDLDGSLVWGKAYELGSQEEMMIAEFPLDGPPLVDDLIDLQTAKTSRAGLLSTSAGPLLIAARPIVDSTGNGPVYGTLVMGRLFGESAVAALSDQVQSSLTAWPVDDPDLPAQEAALLTQLAPGEARLEALDNNLMEGHTVVAGLDGRPSLIISAQIDRTITTTGRDASYSLLLCLLAGGLLVMAATWVILQASIIRPISQLTKQVLEVGKTGDLSLRSNHNWDDEIGILATEFDGMLHKLAKVRGQLEKKSYRSGMAEVASSVTHDIRNALVPITLRSERITDTLREMDDPNVLAALQEFSDPKLAPDRLAKLSRYLTLCIEEHQSKNRTLLDDFQHINGSVNRIEAVLDAQDAISRSPKRLEKVPLAEALEEALSNLPADRKGKASITFDKSLVTARPVAAPKIDLVAVLTSLLANAEDSIVRSGRADGEIEVNSKEEDVDGQAMLHLSIANNGDRLSDAATQDLFQPDGAQSIAAADKRSLHWSANCINQLNGRVFARNEDRQKGTVLHLLLPLAA